MFNYRKIHPQNNAKPNSSLYFQKSRAYQHLSWREVFAYNLEAHVFNYLLCINAFIVILNKDSPLLSQYVTEFPAYDK